MGDLVTRIEGCPEPGRPAQQIGGLCIGEIAVILLRLDNGVEIAAISDIDGEFAQPVDLDVVAAAEKERGTLTIRTRST